MLLGGIKKGGTAVGCQRYPYGLDGVTINSFVVVVRCTVVRQDHPDERIVSDALSQYNKTWVLVNSLVLV